MNWQKSEVMSEFLKIASEQGMVKNAYPENPFQEDLKVIEEKYRKKHPEKHIMEQAHSEPVYIAESRGDGALVENEIENQNKIIEMINKMPTGSLVGRYASAIHNLVVYADKCDTMGELYAADLLTTAAKQLTNDLSFGDEELPLP